jgi:gliding motility-associated-like protein
MKKLLLLLFMFAGLNVFGQLSENFETSVVPAIPAGWTKFDNGIGTVQSWSTTNLGALVLNGTNSAVIQRENVTDGTFAVDWLVSPQVSVPTSPQLRFRTKTLGSGFQGGTFDIRISKISPNNPADFVTLISYDEATLTASANVPEEKVLDLPVATYPPGTLIYIAFVYTNDNGESRWVIDNVNLIQKCNAPIGPLATANESTSTAQLSWGSPGGITQWEVQVCPFADTFGGVSTINYTANTNVNYLATGLQPNTLYKFQVRSICTGGFESDWFGPRSFQTASFGDTCAGPIVVGALPYQTIDNTANHLDTNDITQPLACSSQATNYMTGNDVFYSFTPTFTGNIAINLAPTTANSSIHVYSACPGSPGATCLGGVANSASTPRNINLFPVVAGTTYYIIVSSNGLLNQTVGYTLTIQQVFCNQPTALAATVTSSTTADLSWATSAGTTNWQVSYAPAPYALPTGAGTNTAIPFQPTGLIPGVVYQYYVRADCNDGNFSIWSGPFTFTMPQVATPLNFIDGFETLTGWTLNNGTQTNKWAVGTGINNGGTHALYVTDTNGGTNTYNTTATSVVQAYKDFVIPAGATQLDLTFDWRSLGETGNDYFRVWTVPTTFNPTSGTQITAVVNSRIKIGNDLTANSNFTTQNYTLNATPYAGSTVRLVFEWVNNNVTGNQPPAAIDNVKLNLITCPKPGSLVISNIGYNTAQVTWANGGSESQWEIIVLPAGSAAPTATSTGTTTTIGSPFTIGGLTSVTCYDVYVRAKCSATEFSFWSVPVNFCTTPNYCAGDHFYDTGGIAGNYSNNQAITSIICPDNVGDIVTVVFNDFDVAAGDTLVIRDGNLITSPIVGTYTGTTLPPSFSATSASGCLTFVFTSNGTTVSAGWDATIYCTPPITCFKPVALTANPVGSTTATLTWTETGTASQWEILVLPFGANAPIFGQSGVPANPGSPPHIVTGLSPSTTYTFYVRAICSATNTSFWSDGFTFSTTPINDLCINAITVPVNNGLTCQQTTLATLAGATPSSQAMTGTGCNLAQADDDVWFKFVATRSTHTFEIENITPLIDMAFTIYSGTDCNNLILKQCVNNENAVIDNFVLGQTYYIRAFSTSTTPQLSNFTICVGGIPCTEAISLCTTTITYPNTTNVLNLGTIGCLSTSPNASFFFLEATQTGNLGYNLSQVTTAGAPIDVDYALWGPFATRDAACGVIPRGQAPLSGLTTGCSFSASATENFTIPVLAGQVYILIVTNYANQVGTVTIAPKPGNTAQAACYPYNTFNYPSVTYCQSSAPATPTLIPGAVAGTYTGVRNSDGSTTALSINPVTGVINFVASLPGTYTVTNTIIPNLAAPAQNAPILATAQIIITPVPNATIAYDSATYCKSVSLLQSIAVTGNSGTGSTYSSTPAGLENALDPVTGGIIPILANVGTYTVTLTVPAQGGCAQYTTTTQVQIIAAPIIPAQVDVNACNSYVLPALTVGNYFTATGGTGTQLNAGDVITTNQTIYVYATNGQCTSEDPFNVKIVSIPTPTFDYLTQPTCAVQTGSINITAPVAVGGPVPTNLFISEVTDANTGALSYVELFNGTGATVNLANYRLKMYNNGIVAPTWQQTLTGTVANNSTFVIKISNDPSIPGVVHNFLIPLSGVDNNDNIRLTTLTNIEIDMWGPTNGSIFTPAGQPGYTYRRLASATPLPSTTWDANNWSTTDPVDYSNLGQYTLNSSSYEYSVDGGTYVTTTKFTGLTPGVHYFIVHDLINNCYSAPISFTINAVPYTTAVTDFTYTTPVCITSTTNPTPTLAPGATPGGTFSYVESVSGNAVGLDLNTTNGTINLPTSTAGSYVVTYTYPTNLTNCINTNSSSFTIVLTSFVTATFNQIPSICQGTTAPTLPLSSTNTPPITGTWNAAISTTTPGVTTYTFTPNLGQCGVGTTMDITVFAPNITPIFTQIPSICQGTTAPTLPLSSNNTPPITGTWNSAISTATPGVTTYTFTPNSGQCAVVTTMNITIDPIVVPIFTAIGNICQNDVPPALPLSSNNTPAITGTWFPAAINTANPGTSTYTFTPDGGQCSQVVSISVTIDPSLTPTFTQIDPLCIGSGNVTLPTSSTNTPAINGSWFPAVVDTSVNSTQVYTFTPDVNECATSVTMTIQVELCEIQKGISPNNDGKNDFLELVAKKVEIFNRYGREVYSKTDYNNDWHGQFMGGGEMPDGTYYYVIELVSGEKKTGWIYINREQ